MEIVIKKLSKSELDNLGVGKWPIWEKEKGSFNWHYAKQETCYFLEGKAEIEISGSAKVKIQKGDLVVFPANLSCLWHIQDKVKKHYKFEK